MTDMGVWQGRLWARGGWWAALVIAMLGFSRVQAAEIPQSAADLENRVFVRTAPNGAIETFRMLPGGRFEGPSAVYRTNTYTYDRAGQPADQATLTFGSTDVFSGTPAWRTNRYQLTYAGPDRGAYELQFTINSVPGVQTQAGPFEITAGNNLAPRIWLQPESYALPAGRNLSVSVLVAGYDLEFQWHFNGLPIPNATRSTYITNGMRPELEGEYFCRVSNPLGTVTSLVARVRLLTAPVITRSPAPVEAFEGDAVTFSVTAQGDGLQYEWTINGTPQAVGPDPTFTLPRVAATHAGAVQVRVSNEAGTVISDPVPLRVCAVAVDTTWRGRPWVKILQSNDPVPGSASRFGPLAAPFQPIFTLWRKTIHVVARADDDLATANPPRNALVRWRGGTLSTLVFTNVLRPDGTPFLYPFYPTDEGAGVVNFQEGAMFSWSPAGVTTLVDTTTPVPERPGLRILGPGSFARRDGAVLLSTTLAQADGAPVGVGLYLHDGQTLRRIADDTTDLPGVLTGYAFRATEDSLNLDGTTVVFSTTTGPGGVAGVYRSDYAGNITKLLDTGDLLPGLTNRVVGFGDVDVEGDVVFAIVQVAVGLSTQGRAVAFQRDGRTRVLGNAEYLVASGPREAYFGNAGSIVRWTDGASETVLQSSAVFDCRRLTGLYDVEAQGDDVAVGVVFADRSVAIYANLGAPDPAATGPAILVPPGDVTVPATTPASFKVVASGPAPLTYQWRRDGTELPAATNAVLNVLSPTEADLGAYDVVVTAGGRTVTSSPARLTLGPPPPLPMVFVQPQSVAITKGESVLLAVAAAGAPPLTYQWLQGTDPIAGATAATYGVSVTSNLQFRVVVANGAGVVTSQVASISVVPAIRRQPQPVTVATGGTATFEVEATGFDQFRYLWFRDNIQLVGRTNATLVLESVRPEDEADYSVQIIGIGGGSVRSQRARLTVTGGGGGGSPTPVQLTGVSLEAGQLRFQFLSVAGTTYAIESAPSAGLPWSERSRVAGDGTAQVVRVPTEGAAGLVRVRSLQP